METYILIYIGLSVISILCAVFAIRKDNDGLFNGFVVFALAAGFVLALGLYDPAKKSSGGTLYVSTGGGTGGMSLEAILKTILFAVPPMVIGGLAAFLADRHKKR